MVATAVSAAPQRRYYLRFGASKLEVLLRRGPQAQKAMDDHGTREVHALDFNHDGSLLCSGSLDRLVAVWSMANGELVRILREHVGRGGVACHAPVATGAVTRHEHPRAAGRRRPKHPARPQLGKASK